MADVAGKEKPDTELFPALTLAWRRGFAEAARRICTWPVNVPQSRWGGGGAGVCEIYQPTGGGQSGRVVDERHAGDAARNRGGLGHA